MKYAILEKPYTTLWNASFDEFDDDLFCGWAVEILDEAPEYLRVRTHYGIVSYARPDGFREISREALAERNAECSLLTVTHGTTDVLDRPTYTAITLAVLKRGSFVTACGEPGERYRPVRLPDGREGWIGNSYVTPRKDSDGYLLADDREAWLRAQQHELPSPDFHCAVLETAKSYLGTQYRWGGKSPDGIDCSGLVCMSYMMNGYLVSRCSRAQTDRELVTVPFEEAQPGDMLHAANPGHIMLYMGDGYYIHATSNPLAFGVSINSFDPKEPLFLPGIRERIYAVTRVK